jgi:hypothetical protein
VSSTKVLAIVSVLLGVAVIVLPYFFGTLAVAVPEDWFLALLMDWSGGFWQKAGWWSRGRTAVRNTPDSSFSGRTTGQGFGPERQLNEHFEPASEGREPVGPVAASCARRYLRSDFDED